MQAQETVDQLQQRVQDLAKAGNLKELRLIAERLRAARDKKTAGVRSGRWQANPTGWVEERLVGHTIWSKQRQVMESVRDSRRTAVKSGHGVGKSWVASLVASWWLDTHPPGEAFVVTTAPTYAQVRAILWRYIRRIHKAGKLPGRVNQTEWLIDDELVAFGRKPADHDEAAFQGIHAQYVLVILDEACGIPEDLWIAADALTTGPDCRILAIGNPDNPASHFRKVCLSDAWAQVTISAFDSPNLTGEYVPAKVAAQLVGAEWIEEKRQEWGEDNPLYKSKVLGEFSEDSEFQIIRTSDLAACLISNDPPIPPSAPVVLGVDVAGGGDETVIRERRGIVAGREWRKHTDRPEHIVPLIQHAQRETGATRINVDSIGVGFGVVGNLRNLQDQGKLDATICGVNVAEKSHQPDKFVNLRAEMWWNIGRLHSQDRKWDLSQMENADRTAAQLLVPMYDTEDSRGRIKVERKDEIIKRIGRSPDNADALLLAFYWPSEPQVRWI